MEDIYEAISNYYILKHTYEEKLDRQKVRILRNPSLSIREKRQKFRQMKKFCIKCNKEGGSVFQTNGTILTAICGNTNNPCDLNIQINRGTFDNIRNMNDNIIEDVKDVQNDIIKIKLDLLFNYKEENTAISEFEKVRKLLGEDLKILDFTKTELIKIIDNPERNAELKEAMNQFYIQKDRLKLLHKEYNTRLDTTLINDMVELYVSKIQPLATKIRNLQYKYCAIETNEKKIHKLIEDSYSYEELFIVDVDNEPAIISNIY